MTPAERIDYLEAQVRQLKDALGQGMRWPLHWGLSRTETAMLGLLVAREVVTRDMFLTAVWVDRDEPDGKCIDVHLTRLRKRGFRIRNKYAQGWYLDEQDRYRLRGDAIM